MTDIIKAETNSLAAVTPLPIDHNPAAVYLSKLTNQGARVMRDALNRIARMFGADTLTQEIDGKPQDWTCLNMNWAAVRYDHAAAIRARLVDQYGVASTNRMLSALRGVLKAAWRLKQMTAEDYHLAAGIESVKGETVPAGRELTTGEISALLAACEADPTPAGIRDAAIISLGYICGPRRAEIARADLADYDPTTGRLLIRGKGNKERFVYVTNGAFDFMADWLEIRGSAPGALFYAINKGGIISNDKLTGQAIYYLEARRGAEAGIKGFSPHDLRRTFVSHLLAAGVDIATVAKMAGHASVLTTSRYDRRPEEAKRKAAELLHVPYHRRGSK